MNIQSRLKNSESRLDRWIIAAFFGSVGIFTIMDVIIDLGEKTQTTHLAVEAAIALTSLAGFLYFVFRKKMFFAAWIAESEKSKKATLESIAWQEKNKKLSQGLTDAIDEQLTQWKLTAAERDVALYLLKGLSSIEIAELRGASEKTIRQQCSNIYAKSGVAGRAEFAAFFLEDLLVIK